MLGRSSMPRRTPRFTPLAGFACRRAPCVGSPWLPGGDLSEASRNFSQETTPRSCLPTDELTCRCARRRSLSAEMRAVRVAPPSFEGSPGHLLAEMPASPGPRFTSLAVSRHRVEPWANSLDLFATLFALSNSRGFSRRPAPERAARRPQRSTAAAFPASAFSVIRVPSGKPKGNGTDGPCRLSPGCSSPSCFRRRARAGFG
jgi:hypothetical protein